MTAGILPSRRRRRTAREPVGRPISAASTTSAMTNLLRWRERWSRTAQGLRRTAYQRSRTGPGRTTGRPPVLSDQVVPAEELGDRGVLEDGVNGVGDDLGDGQNLELVEDPVLGHRQGIGPD